MKKITAAEQVNKDMIKSIGTILSAYEKNRRALNPSQTSLGNAKVAIKIKWTLRKLLAEVM